MTSRSPPPPKSAKRRKRFESLDDVPVSPSQRDRRPPSAPAGNRSGPSASGPVRSIPPPVTLPSPAKSETELQTTKTQTTKTTAMMKRDSRLSGDLDDSADIPIRLNKYEHLSAARPPSPDEPRRKTDSHPLLALRCDDFSWSRKLWAAAAERTKHAAILATGLYLFSGWSVNSSTNSLSSSLPKSLPNLLPSL